MMVFLSMVPGIARLTAVDRSLSLDGHPWLMRAVTYAPTPIGDDPALGHTTGIFGADFAALHARDFEYLQEMGANAIRVYELSTPDSADFFARAAAANMTVMAGFGLYVPAGDRASAFLATPSVLERVKEELRAKLRTHDHPALTLWSVGNEVRHQSMV